MIILGITDTVCQDNAAAILVDGELVAMVEEERLNRIKHAPRMAPQKAIQWCLDMAKVKIEDVDIIAIGFDHPNTVLLDNMKNKVKRFLKRQTILRNAREEYRYWKRHRYHLAQLDPYLKLRDKVMFVRHHLAHAASSFYLSGFEEANIISLDGSGGQDAGLLGIGRGTEIETVHHVDRETSWGEFYERFTGALGFKPHSDEGKVMGLAAYGNPRGELFPFIHMSNGTEFPHYDREGFLKTLASVRPRQPGVSPINGYHEEVAARLQYALEQVVGKMSEVLNRQSGFTDLCMAGGTALNCSCNGKLLSLPHVKRIFVQPAAADCGTALGAAVYAHVKLTGRRPKTKFNHLYWGPEFSNQEIEPVLRAAKVPYRKVEDIGAETAKLIRDNKIVGWFQGRMEVGPRALGGRSILANPMDVRMKDAVNNHVKFRESWRPFAPSILVGAHGGVLRNPPPLAVHDPCLPGARGGQGQDPGRAPRGRHGPPADGRTRDQSAVLDPDQRVQETYRRARGPQHQLQRGRAAHRVHPQGRARHLLHLRSRCALDRRFHRREGHGKRLSSPPAEAAGVARRPPSHCKGLPAPYNV